MELRVKRLASCSSPTELPLPKYQTSGSAGVDLSAAIECSLVLAPGDRALIPTGIALEIPIGFEGQVRPRSGLAMKFGVTTLNTPGTIDADYRGEIGVLLINHGAQAFTVNRGDRIAQLVVASVFQAHFIEVGELSETIRGDGGFGHTGISKGQQPL